METAEHYYAIQTPEHISESEEIYITAPKITFQAGTLVATNTAGDVILALAPGQWFAIYAASVIDGGAVSAIEHWAGKVAE